MSGSKRSGGALATRVRGCLSAGSGERIRTLSMNGATLSVLSMFSLNG